MIWTKKYAPKNSKELVGDIRAIMQLEDFVINYKNQKKKALLIYGPTGSGKTEAVYALAREKDLEIVELNASDFRDKESILEIVGKAINQGSLFGNSKIILVDEVDGLSGMKDRGGATALASIIPNSSFPIVMTANDPWQKKLSGLRKKSNTLEFAALNYLEIFKVLKRISENENILVSDDILKGIANRSGGDIRSAINDFQLIAFGRKEVLKEHLDEIGERSKEEEIYDLLRIIFKSKDQNLILQTFDKTNLNFDEVKIWIEENIPKEYKGIEIRDAFDNLSKSDVFKGRIIRRQHWRFLVYQKYFMSVGVAIAKKESKKGFVKYEQSTRILKMWMAKMKYGKKISICEKIADNCHLSSKKSIKEVFPYAYLFLKQEKDYLDLNEEEFDWLS